MTKNQQKDADECNQMMDQGRTKECFGCSCNVCLLTVSDNEQRIEEMTAGIKGYHEQGADDLGTINRLQAETKKLKDIIKDLLELGLTPHKQKDIDYHKEARCSECDGECTQSNDLCSIPDEMLKFNELIKVARDAISG